MSGVEDEIKTKLIILKAEQLTLYGRACLSNSQEDLNEWAAKGIEIVSFTRALWELRAARTKEIEQPATKENSNELYKTGAPGRPSPIQFIDEEARRRRHSGEALEKLSHEAKALEEWCKTAHPVAKTPTSLTIENRIREEHNNWKIRATPQN
jgi:hypothetical protein